MELGDIHIDQLMATWLEKLITTEAMRKEISDHYRVEFNRMNKTGEVDLKNWAPASN